MKSMLRSFAAATILTLAASAMPLLAAVPAQDRDHQQMDRDHQQMDRNDHPEYNNNRYYRLGNSEGYKDHARNVQRKQHNHAYKTDDDRKAHDYGYQQGWQGQRYNANRH